MEKAVELCWAGIRRMYNLRKSRANNFYLTAYSAPVKRGARWWITVATPEELEKYKSEYDTSISFDINWKKRDIRLIAKLLWEDLRIKECLRNN